MKLTLFDCGTMAETKTCTKCGEEKPRDGFHKRAACSDGLSSWCKACVNAHAKVYKKKNKEVLKEKRLKYYEENKEMLAGRCREYYEKNKEAVLKQKRQYQAENMGAVQSKKKEYRDNNKDKIAEYNQAYYAENKDAIAKQSKAYYQTEEGKAKRNAWQNKRNTIPKYCISNRMRAGLHYSLRRMGLSKNGAKWESLVGYTKEDLIVHLESLFTDGMSWDNIGEWEIDHIIPISYFEFDSVYDAEFRFCWSLENLQPLWSEDNLMKSDQLI